MDLLQSGWLSHVKHKHSPNFNQRPVNKDISLLVIHSISLPPGEYGNCYIDDFFCNNLLVSKHPYFQEICHLQVSSHILIRRDGELTQYVSFLDRAWHAGQSSFRGRENCNDFSIGIELEGLEGFTFEAAQYQKLAELSALLMKHYPDITRDRIAGHSDIAPQRKFDPGSGFDWQYYFECLDMHLPAKSI